MRVRGREGDTVEDDSQSIHGNAQTHHVLCNLLVDTMNTPCRRNETLKLVFLMKPSNLLSSLFGGFETFKEKKISS